MKEELTRIILAKARLMMQAAPERISEAHGFLIENFGQTATVAIYLALLALVLLALFRSCKFSFDLLRFVLIPTTAVAFIGSLLLPFSFVTIAPFAAIVFSAVLFLKG
jgi:hypothetical protein